MSIERIYNRFRAILKLAVLVLGCNVSVARSGSAQNPSDTTRKAEVVTQDTIPRVTGIGGIFFKCDSPKVVREWYGKNLGLALDAYGATFFSLDVNNPERVARLQWSPFKSSTKYFEPSQREFMINYRVNAIEALIKKFKENGVTIVDTLETYDYGKFIHIMDPFGNKIELWEPVDSVLNKADEKPTK